MVWQLHKANPLEHLKMFGFHSVQLRIRFPFKDSFRSFAETLKAQWPRLDLSGV